MSYADDLPAIEGSAGQEKKSDENFLQIDGAIAASTSAEVAIGTQASKEPRNQESALDVCAAQRKEGSIAALCSGDVDHSSKFKEAQSV
mmetsp:Transcript_3322/g.7065  ORF Transcript_3322/g.7065 Transcript_3322/m.7065 type:complete len:89 (+) Transcript_3322:3-269(+)